MASHVARGQLIIQNENFDVLHKKAEADGKNKSSKTATKKGGMGFGGRKALNDITNKSILHHEVSSKKKSSQKEFNILEEKFLHDHKKCVEAQHMSINTFLDLVLPGHDSIPTAEYPDSKNAETGLDSLHCYTEPVELSMSEFADFLESPTQWDSPPSSPERWDFPPSSPLAWQFKAVDFVLKQEN